MLLVFGAINFVVLIHIEGDDIVLGPNLEEALNFLAICILEDSLVLYDLLDVNGDIFNVCQ